MTSCPLTPDRETFHAWIPSSAQARRTAPGWTRKTFALGLHAACWGLFGLAVVWPVVGPLASGEAARDFALAQQALAEWLLQAGFRR